MQNDKVRESEIFRNRKTPGNGHVSSALVNAYLDNRLSMIERRDFETTVNTNSALKNELLRKRDEKEFILSLIPNKKLSAEVKSSMKIELRDINNSIIPETETSLIRKITGFFDKTIIEF